MNNEQIYQALLTQLKTVTGLYPLQTENQSMSAKGAFSRASIIRSRPGQLTVGVTGKDLHAAIFQIDLFVPVNTGTAAGNALADEVIAAFPKGLGLEADGHTIHITKSYRETAARLNDQWHNVPVVVEYSLVA